MSRFSLQSMAPIILIAIKSDRTGRSWYQKKYLRILGVIFLGITIAFSNDEMQTAKIVAVKKHAEGRIISWQGRIPIFDNYPFFDITLRWKSKNYVVRCESPGAYYPKAWETGKDIRVRRERGRFLLYRGDETVSAREVNVHDCVQTSFPSPSVTPQVPCD